jgi:hypothetical protein
MMKGVKFLRSGVPIERRTRAPDPSLCSIALMDRSTALETNRSKILLERIDLEVYTKDFGTGMCVFEQYSV